MTRKLTHWGMMMVALSVFRFGLARVDYALSARKLNGNMLMQRFIADNK